MLDPAHPSRSQDHLRQTLKESEEVLGKKYPDTLTSINNLAVVLQHQRKHSDAKGLYALRSWMGRDVPGLDFGEASTVKVITSLRRPPFLVGLFLGRDRSER